MALSEQTKVKILSNVDKACIPSEYVMYYQINFKDDTVLVLEDIEQIYEFIDKEAESRELMCNIRCVVDGEQMLLDIERDISYILKLCFKGQKNDNN